MTLGQSPKIRGWCPGALQPMQSGDGLLVRVRPNLAALTVDQLRAVAFAATHYGNGLIDLTRRANIQIRGVKEESFHGLCAALDGANLLDESVTAESVRNIIISPLAGVDPTEHCDVRPHARRLIKHLQNNKAFAGLSNKFGFALDGGGALSVNDVDADIRLKAVSSQDTAVALGSNNAAHWLGLVRANNAAEIAAELARVFLRFGSPKRMNQCSAHQRQQLSDAIANHLKPNGDVERAQQHTARQGAITHNGKVIAVGATAPFGRIDADKLLTLADALKQLDIEELRISPWRTIYVPVRERKSASTVLKTLADLQFIIDPLDPILRIDACPGAPHCSSSQLDTRADARRVASALTGAATMTSIHVSGCTKGCARSTNADIVLVGSDDQYGIVRNGRADEEPISFVAAQEVDKFIRHECQANKEFCDA